MSFLIGAIGMGTNMAGFGGAFASPFFVLHLKHSVLLTKFQLPHFRQSQSPFPFSGAFGFSVCGVCVLKREHHCMFAGYCVGHFNHRFFVLFLAWLWLGVLYCTYLNSLYVWTGENSYDGYDSLN